LRKLRDSLLDIITLIVGVSAMVLLGVMVRDRTVGALSSSAPRQQVIEDYEQYATRGHQMGPRDALVTIIEWGDYQCPACRGFESVLGKIKTAYPDEVAVLYRHWPLTLHDRAYPAARAAECASRQQSFAAYHALLYDNGDWMLASDVNGEFLKLAARANVPDLEAFGACIADSSPHPAIEADIAAVKRLGGRGTPTVLVNRTLVAGVPDSADLAVLIDAELAR